MVKNPESVYFVRGLTTRKQSFIRWTREVARDTGTDFNDIRNLISKRKFKEAYIDFGIKFINMAKKEGEPFLYIVEENINKFGLDSTLYWLFRNLILNPVRTGIIKGYDKYKTVELKDLVKRKFVKK